MKPKIQAGGNKLLTAKDSCATATCVRKTEGNNGVFDEPEIRKIPKRQQIILTGKCHGPN